MVTLCGTVFTEVILVEKRTADSGMHIVELRWEHFIMGLLSGSYNLAGAKREATRLGIPAVDYQYVCMLFSADKMPLTSALIDPAGLVQEMLRKHGRGFAISLPNAAVLGVLSLPGNRTKFDRIIYESAEEIKTRLELATEETVTVGVGEIVYELSNLNASFAAAKKCLDRKEYTGGDRIYTYTEPRQVLPDCPYALPCEKRLSSSVRKGSLIDAKQNIEEIRDALEKMSDSLRPIDYKFFFLETVVCLSMSTGASAKSDRRVCSANLNIFEMVARVKDSQSYTEEAGAYLESLFKLSGTKEKSKKRLQIDTAVSYINSHYSEKITLEDLAELCELSVSYFCKLFKSEIGESFADYLTWVRIEKAIDLLRDPKMKIYEISEEVGYSDVQYFNKVFRDTTGVSPSFYRNHLLFSSD